MSASSTIAPADAALLRGLAGRLAPGPLADSLHALTDVLEQITLERVRLLNRALEMGCCGVVNAQDDADHDAGCKEVPPLLDALEALATLGPRLSTAADRSTIASSALESPNS